MSIKNHIQLKLGIQEIYENQKSQPEDYTPGLLGLMLFGGVFINPYDQLENYEIAVGKIYKLSKNPLQTERLNVSIGLGYTISREPENWRRKGGIPVGPNYDWNYNKLNTVSLIINAKIELPFARFYGLTISPMLQINKDRAYFGVGIGQMVGLLRKE